MSKSITEAGPATLGRTLARELTAEEADAISGADGTTTGSCSFPIEPGDCEADIDCE